MKVWQGRKHFKVFYLLLSYSNYQSMPVRSSQSNPTQSSQSKSIQSSQSSLTRHRGQTSEDAREIAQGSQIASFDSKRMWSRLRLIVSEKRNFLFTSMKFLADNKEEEEELKTWIVSMLKYAFVLIFSDCFCINFVDQWLDAQLMPIVRLKNLTLSSLYYLIRLY